MQTIVRFILVCRRHLFVIKIIKHSIKAIYNAIFLTNCTNTFWAHTDIYLPTII